MKQYKKKTYAKTVKKTVHPKHRSGSKSTMPADSQMRGKPFEFVANEVVRHQAIAFYFHLLDYGMPFVHLVIDGYR